MRSFYGTFNYFPPFFPHFFLSVFLSFRLFSFFSPLAVLVDGGCWREAVTELGGLRSSSLHFLRLLGSIPHALTLTIFLSFFSFWCLCVLLGHTVSQSNYRLIKGFLQPSCQAGPRGLELRKSAAERDIISCGDQARVSFQRRDWGGTLKEKKGCVGGGWGASGIQAKGLWEYSWPDKEMGLMNGCVQQLIS